MTKVGSCFILQLGACNSYAGQRLEHVLIFVLAMQIKLLISDIVFHMWSAMTMSAPTSTSYAKYLPIFATYTEERQMKLVYTPKKRCYNGDKRNKNVHKFYGLSNNASAILCYFHSFWVVFPWTNTVIYPTITIKCINFINCAFSCTCRVLQNFLTIFPVCFVLGDIFLFCLRRVRPVHRADIFDFVRSSLFL